MRINNNGFMLLQVLMGAALLGVLGLAFAGLMRNMMMENQGLQSKASELSLIQALTQQVSNPKTCFNSLVDKSYTTNKALKFKLNESDPDTDAVAEGSTVKNWDLQVRTFRFTNATVAAPSFMGETVVAGDMELETQATTGKKMAYKKKSIGKLFLKVRDAGQVITSCYTDNNTQGTSEAICKSLKGTMSGARCDFNSTIKSDVIGAVGSCPSGQSLIGFDSGGGRICGAIPNKLAEVGTCPGGQTLMGFDGNGNKICGAIPVPAPPSSIPNFCVNNTGRNCCPAAGNCVKTGEALEHTGSGGRGGYDVSVSVYMCFCS